MIIDFRVRPPFGSFLNAVPYKDLVRTEFVCNRMGTYLPDAARNRSVEQMILEMDKAGISKAVIPGRKINPALGTVDNNDVQFFVEQYPERFIGFMGVNPHEKWEALNEIERRVIRGPLTGVILECGMEDPPLYADAMEVLPIYKLCQENDIPVIILHGANAGPDISYSAPLPVDRVAAMFPNLKIIISHGGWPWVTQMLHVAWRRPNIYISPDMYMVNFPGWTEYVQAADRFLKDRFLFGTAYPFVPFEEGVRFLRNSGISEEILPDILYNNAAKLLKIDQ